MGACVSRRGDRAECRRCARLPPPSSASPFADAVADAALVRAPPKRRASFPRAVARRVPPDRERARSEGARGGRRARRVRLRRGLAQREERADDAKLGRRYRRYRRLGNRREPRDVRDVRRNLTGPAGLSGLFAAFVWRRSLRYARHFVENSANSYGNGCIIERVGPGATALRRRRGTRKVTKKFRGKRRDARGVRRARTRHRRLRGRRVSVRVARWRVGGGALCWVWWVWKLHRRNDDSRTRRRRKRPSSGGA